MLRSRRLAALAPALGIALALASCATNPVTGRRELSLVSPSRELQLGREGHEAILSEFGVYDDPALAAFVDSVGQSLARNSHMPTLRWTFTVLDDPTVNAFATPGGYIYITRGILAHLNSEAQLAGVLGHEIGHVTARHSAQRLTQQRLGSIGLTLASVFSEGFRRYSEAAQTALGLVFLKYGRDDENQADDLGVEYSTKAGYDPREIPATYTMLKRVGERAGQRLPAFLSTHPDPGDREERTRRLSSAAAAGKRGLVIQSRGFLQRLDRVVFGRDPRNGYFEGTRYVHPRFAFTLDVPSGWKTQDSHSSVVAAGPGERAMMQLTLADAGTLSPSAYARDLVRRGRVVDASGAAESLDGAAAWVGRLTVQGSAGAPAALTAAYVRNAEDRMLQILGRSAEPGDADDGRIVASMRSYRRLVERARLEAAPDRVRIVRVSTPGRFDALLPGFGAQAIDSSATSILNNVRLDEEILAGQSLKIVAPGRTR